MKQGPQKNIPLLTTQMTTTSNHEARTTEEHHSSWHTDHCNKQPWSKDNWRASIVLPHRWLQQCKQPSSKEHRRAGPLLTTLLTATSNVTMKQGPQKNLALLTTQMTATSNHEARTTEEHHTSYHTDDRNKQPWSKCHRRASHFLPHWSLQQATMKQGPHKNIALLTTQMTATRNHEVRVTEEHHTSYHTAQNNKQPWSKDHRRTFHFLPHKWPQQATMKQGPQKSITLLGILITATSNHEARTTEEHQSSCHTDDYNKQPSSKENRKAGPLLTTLLTATSNITMKQGPQKNLALLTTQMAATSNHEASVTQEHHTSYQTDDRNKQP